MASKNISRQERRNTVEQKPAKYTLIGAGITEMYYFKHLNSIKENFFVEIQPQLCDRESIDIIEKRINTVLNGQRINNKGHKIRRDKTRVVCVFDADEATRKPQEGKRFNELKKKYKDNPDVLICDSMPSIEYWFLLHYENTFREMTAKEALKGVQRHIKNFDKTVKFLRQEKWVADMLPNLNLACQRAKDNTDKPSYTNLYKIFEQQ